jgi:aflatoxin B1 aldehyde reductase
VNRNERLPSVILGTVTFGSQADEKAAERMVALFLDRGYREFDTAYSYCDGLTEEILGRILDRSRRQKISLATKIHPMKGGGLTPGEIARQLETSLRRLKTEYVDLLYFHAPDLKTPIEATLEGCHRLFEQGKFKTLGLSNYAAWQVADIWHLCKRRGWGAPVVYQGRYNAITRDGDRELFPALRAFGVKFYGYNPLAGGFLTGKYVDPENKPTEGRFVLYPRYMTRYWRGPHFRAVETIREACKAHGLTMADVAIRWMMHHSLLRGDNGDGVIVGATRVEQLEKNLESCSGGKLPEALVVAFDEAWEIVGPECPPYFKE